jgi:hypothetical protein
MKNVLNKFWNLVKENKFVSIVATLIILALVGPIFFGDLTGDLIMDLLPDWAQTTIYTIIVVLSVYYGVIILFMFGTGVYNMVIGNKGIVKKEEDYKTVKLIARIVGIVTSIILTYLAMFA